jgi:hypothetical protein
MHDMVTFQPQNSDPATSASQIALYTKLISAIPQLFYRPTNSQTPIQMTFESLLTDGSFAQYSFVAGPFIVYFGKLVGVSDGQVIVLTPGTTLLYIDLTYSSPLGVKPPVATDLVGNSFTLNASVAGGGVFDVFYFALGV